VGPERSWPIRVGAQVGTATGEGLRSVRRAPGFAVAILFLYPLFEYLRIHEIFPILGALNLQTAILAVLFAIIIIETAKGGVRRSQQTSFLLGFFGLTVFTIFTAINQYWAYQFAYGLALILIGYFAITHLLRNERDLKGFLSLLVGIHVYLSVKGIQGYGQTQFDQFGYASTGQVGGYFLSDENDLALAMVIILPLGIGLFRQARSLPGRIFWGIGSGMILLTVIFTFSRGGFLGLAAMGLYWVITSKNKVKAISAFVLAGALVMAVAPSEYWSRMETIKETDQGTALGRRNAWGAARRMFYDSPIWGVGGYNAGILLPDYLLDVAPDQRGREWGRAIHSMYFQLLSEFGLIGVLLIGQVLFLSFRDLRQVLFLSREGGCSASIGQLADSLRVSWVGFLVSAVFISVLQYPHLYYLTALTIVVRGLAFRESTELAFEPAGVLEEAG